MAFPDVGLVLSTSWGILDRHHYPSTRLHRLVVVRHVARAEVLGGPRFVLLIEVVSKSPGPSSDQRKGIRIFV